MSDGPQPQEIELDPECIHEGCHMPGEITLCVSFFMPASDVPYTYFFNSALCEYHRWTDEHVEQFLDDNWQAIAQGFGLGVLPERETAGWAFVPWLNAVEFWRKLAVRQQNPTKAVIH